MPKYIITLIVLIVMIVIVLELRYHNNILKKIIFEDKIGTHLNKPLTIKKYEKLFKYEFEPYLLHTTSNINEELFNRFLKFYEPKIIEGAKIPQPLGLHIIFLNKVDGYICDNSHAYDLRIKNDIVPYYADADEIKIVDALMNLKYTEQDEFNIDGIIRINNRDHFLADLTSISSYKNTRTDTGKQCSDLVFNFGPVVEYIKFDTFEDSFDYLFNDDNSDIRLIEKIANTSLISEMKEGL
jgi:hypothetical protein